MILSVQLMLFLIQLYFQLLTLTAVFARFVPALKPHCIPYGKLLQKQKQQQKFPLFVNWLFFKVPKQWFAYFYVWGALWNTVMIYLSSNWSHIQLLYQLHLLRRVYESFFIEKHSKSKMLSAHALVGFSFYTATPLCLLLEQSVDLKYRFLSFFLFFAGNFLQFNSHASLASLRNQESERYFLPSGSFFKSVSHPHYFAEILIYFSLWMKLPYNGPFLYCLIWVIVNLSIMGYENHQWYLSQCKNGKEKKEWQQKKILIPFIF